MMTRSRHEPAADPATPSLPGRRRLGEGWLVLVPVAALVAGLLAYRAWTALPTAPPTPPAPAAPGAPWQAVDDRLDRWGLPAAPGAERWVVRAGDFPEGSATYRLRTGTSAAVAAFYRRALTERGWKLLGETPSVRHPIEDGTAPGGVRYVRAWRLIAAHEEKDVLLVASFIEQPFPNVAVEVAIGFSRYSTSGFRDRASSPHRDR